MTVPSTVRCTMMQPQVKPFSPETLSDVAPEDLQRTMTSLYSEHQKRLLDILELWTTLFSQLLHMLPILNIPETKMNELCKKCANSVLTYRTIRNPPFEWISPEHMVLSSLTSTATYAAAQLHFFDTQLYGGDVNQEQKFMAFPSVLFMVICSYVTSLPYTYVSFRNEDKVQCAWDIVLKLIPFVAMERCKK